MATAARMSRSDGLGVLDSIDQTDTHVPARHAFEVLQAQPQAVMDARPPLLDLPLKVLRKRLHHRLGHEVPDLRPIEVVAPRIDVGNGEEALGRLGQKGFAQSARRAGRPLEAHTDCRGGEAHVVARVMNSRRRPENTTQAHPKSSVHKRAT